MTDSYLITDYSQMTFEKDEKPLIIDKIPKSNTNKGREKVSISWYLNFSNLIDASIVDPLMAS